MFSQKSQALLDNEQRENHPIKTHCETHNAIEGESSLLACCVCTDCLKLCIDLLFFSFHFTFLLCVKSAKSWSSYANTFREFFPYIHTFKNLDYFAFIRTIRLGECGCERICINEFHRVSTMSVPF